MFKITLSVSLERYILPIFMISDLKVCLLVQPQEGSGVLWRTNPSNVSHLTKWEKYVVLFLQENEQGDPGGKKKKQVKGMTDSFVLHELLACWVSIQLFIVPTCFICKYTGTRCHSLGKPSCLTASIRKVKRDPAVLFHISLRGMLPFDPFDLFQLVWTSSGI